MTSASLSTRNARNVFTGDFNGVTSLALSPDGQNLVVNNATNGGAIILNATTGAKGLALPTPDQGGVNAVAYSPDGKIIAASEGNNVLLWDATTGQVIKTFNGPNAASAGLAFSPDGKTLAVGYADNNIYFWNLTLGIGLPPLPGHTESVNSVAYSPDGKYFASGSNDQTVILWTTGSSAANS